MRSNSFQGGESPGGAAHDAADIPAPAYVTELFNDLHDAPAELNALDPSKADRNTKIRDLALAVSGAMDLFEHHLARTPILTSVNSYIQFLGQLKSYVEEAPHAIVDMDPQAAILFNAVSAQIDRVANSRARLNPTAVDDDANPLESCCKTMRSAARRCLGRAIDSDVEMADDASIHSSPSPQTESSPAPDAQDPPAYVKSLFQSLGHLQVNSTSSAKGEVGSGRLNTFGWAAHSLMTALESDMEEIEVLPCEWPLQLLEKLKTTFAGLSEIDGIDTETEMLFTAASNSIKHLEARLSDDIVSEGAIGHELNTLMDALCWNVQTAVATYLSASDDLDVEMANASPESIDAGDALEREAQDREPTWGGIARNPRRRPIAGEESDEDSPPRKKQKLGDKDKGKSLAARDDEIGDSATPQEGIILKQEILDLYEHGDQSLRVGALKSVQDIVLFLGNKQFLDKGKSEYWATKGTKKYLSKWLNDYVDAYLSNNNLTIQEAFKTFDSFIKHRDAMMNVAETEGYIPVPTRDGERSKMINVRSAWNTVAEAFFEIPLIEYVKKHFPESLSQHLYAICDFAIHLQEEKVNFETMTPQSFSSEVLAMLSQSKYKKFTKHVNALHSLRDALFPYGLRDQVVTMDPNMSTSNKTGALQLETYLLSQDINYTDYQPSPSRYRDRIEKWWNKPKNAGIGRALTLSATMPEKKPALNTPPPVSDWRRSNEDRHAKTKQHSEIVNDPDISETEPLDAKAEAYKTSDSAIPLKDSARERVEGAGRTKKSMTVLLTGGAYGGANHKLINAAIEPGKTLLDHMKTLADFANFERRVWAQPHVASTSVNTKHNLSALLDQLCDAAFDVPIMMYTLERVGRGDKGRTLNAARRLGKALAEKGAHFTDRKALLQAMLKIAESLKAEKTEILSDFMNIRRKLFKHPVDEIFLEELKVRKTTDNELTTSRIAAAGGIALALEVMKPPISWAEFIKKPLDHLDKISSVLKKVMTQKRLTDAIKILDDWSKGSVYHPSVSKPRLWYTPTIASFRRRLGGNMRALYKRRGIDAHEAAKAPVAELEKKSVQEERRLPRTQAARMDRDGGESETESNASSIEIPTRHRSARPTRFQGPFYQDADSEMSDTEPSRPVPAPENEESHSQDARLADAPSLPPSAVPRQPGLFHYRGPDETNPYKQIHLLMQRHADGTESVVGPAEPAKLLPDQGQDRLLPWACPHNSSHVEERYRLSDKPGEQHLVHPDVEILSAHIEGDDLALLQDYYAHQRFNVSYDEGYAALKPKQKTEVAKWIKALEANALAHVNAMRQGKPLYEKTLEVAPVTEADAAHHEIHVMTEEKMDGVRVKASLAGKEPTLLRKQFLGPFGGPVYKQSELDQKKGLHQRDATYLLDVGESEAAAGETPEPLLMDGQNKMASINTAVRFNPKTGALEYDGDRLNAFLIGVNFTIKDKFDGPPHKRRLAFVAGEDGGLKAGQSVLVGYGDHYSQYLNRHYLDKYTARYKDRVGEWMRTFRDELKRLRDAGEPPAEQRYGTFIPWMVAAENRRKPGLNAEMFDSIDALQRRLAASAGETTLRGLLNVGKDDTHRVAFNLHRDANGAVHLQVLEPAVRADYLPEIEAKLCPDAADRITHFPLRTQKSDFGCSVFSLSALLKTGVMDGGRWRLKPPFARGPNGRAEGLPAPEPGQKIQVIKDCSRWLDPDFFKHTNDPTVIEKMAEDKPAWEPVLDRLTTKKLIDEDRLAHPETRRIASTSIEEKTIVFMNRAIEEHNLSQQLREKALRKEASLVAQAQAIRVAHQRTGVAVDAIVRYQQTTEGWSAERVRRVTNLAKSTDDALTEQAAGLRNALDDGIVLPPTPAVDLGNLKATVPAELPVEATPPRPPRWKNWDAVNKAYDALKDAGHFATEDHRYARFAQCVDAFIGYAKDNKLSANLAPQALSQAIRSWLDNEGKEFKDDNPRPSLALNNLAKVCHPDYRFKTHLGIAERVLTAAQQTEIDKTERQYQQECQQLGLPSEGYRKHIKTVYRVLLESLPATGSPLDALRRQLEGQGNDAKQALAEKLLSALSQNATFQSKAEEPATQAELRTVMRHLINWHGDGAIEPALGRNADTTPLTAQRLTTRTRAGASKTGR